MTDHGASVELLFADRLLVRVEWLIAPNGDLAVDFRSTPIGVVPPIQRLGLELEFDAATGLDRLTWFGPGPLETYRDRVRRTADRPLHHLGQPTTTSPMPGPRTAATTPTSAGPDPRRPRDQPGLLAIGSPRFDCPPSTPAPRTSRPPPITTRSTGGHRRWSGSTQPTPGWGPPVAGRVSTVGIEVPAEVRNRIILRAGVRRSLGEITPVPATSVAALGRTT